MAGGPQLGESVGLYEDYGYEAERKKQLEMRIENEFLGIDGGSPCRMLKKELALAPAVALGQLTRG